MGFRWVCWLAGVALIATACAGGDGSSVDAGPIDSETDLSIDVADDPTVKLASELAVTLVDHLGDDDTAAGAVLLAGDTGYSINQIEVAIVSARWPPMDRSPVCRRTVAAGGSLPYQPTNRAAGPWHSGPAPLPRNTTTWSRSSS